MSTVTVRDIELHYEIAGKGPTFIWGHGLSSSRVSEDRLELFEWKRIRKKARLVRYDARGHGDSESTADPSTYHWRELALDQLALADALGVDSYIAGGASMGCATALHAATIAPQRIIALVLAIPPTAWATRAVQAQGYEISAQLIESGDLDQMIAGFRSAPTPDPFAGNEAWLDGFEDTIRTADPVRMARVFRGAATADFPDPESIAQLIQPTLILAWTGDPGHPMVTADRLLELMPHAQIHSASTMQQLSTWTDTIVEFLESRF